MSRYYPRSPAIPAPDRARFAKESRYATQPQYLEPDEGDQDVVTEEHSKRDIVAQMLLQFPDMSSKEIAAECGVSKRYVNRVRREIQGGN